MRKSRKNSTKTAQNREHTTNSIPRESCCQHRPYSKSDIYSALKKLWFGCDTITFFEGAIHNNCLYHWAFTLVSKIYAQACTLRNHNPLLTFLMSTFQVLGSAACLLLTMPKKGKITIKTCQLDEFMRNQKNIANYKLLDWHRFSQNLAWLNNKQTPEVRNQESDLKMDM